MNKNLFLVGAAALLASSCDYNDKYFDELDELLDKSQLTISSNSYELSDADYKSLGASNGYFSSQEEAREALVSFVADKYPTLDNGSSVNIIYKLIADQDDVVAALANASVYAVSDDDYSSVGTVANLTPKTVNSVASFLKSGLADAKAGDYAVVTYKYSDSVEDDAEQVTTQWAPISLVNEPNGTSWNYVNSGNVNLSAYVGQKIRLGFRYTSSTAASATIEIKNLIVGEPVAYVLPSVFAKQDDGSFKLVSEIAADGQYVLAAKVADNQYIPAGKLQNTSKTYGYFAGDTVSATSGVLAAADVADYVLSIAKSDKGYTIKDAQDRYIYMSGTYNSFNVSADLQSDGCDWSISFNADGSASVVNLYNSKFLSYSVSYKSFGAYVEETVKSVEYFNNSLLSESLPDGFSVVDITKPSEISNIWYSQTKYGFTAKGNVSKTYYDTESWIVSAELDLSSASAPYVSFDICGNYFDSAPMSDYFSLFVSTDYAEGAAFAILGDGEAPVVASSDAQSVYAVYKFDGSSWSEASDVLTVSNDDFAAIGSKYGDFSSSLDPAYYLPRLLASQNPFAVADDEKVVVYPYYSSTAKADVYKADKYVYDGSVWALASTTTNATDQFVRANGSWMFDPTVTIDLPYSGKPAATAAFYQAMTDWVWANVDQAQLGVSAKGNGYVTSYGNNDYYSGASAYYCECDWRPAKFREQYADGYSDCADDDAVMERVKEHFIECLCGTLSVLYPEAAPISGIDVNYVINFWIYNTSGAYVEWTITYKVIETGKFEYVDGSMMEL